MTALDQTSPIVPRLFERSDRPRIICLCGSTRFMDAFHEANRRESLAGNIVLTVEIVAYDGTTDPQRANPDQKARLDELHLRKIDLADEILVLNVGGYIGESTRREIDYARQHCLPIRYLEPIIPPNNGRPRKKAWPRDERGELAGQQAMFKGAS